MRNITLHDTKIHESWYGTVLPNYHGAMTRTMKHWHSPHTKRKEVKVEHLHTHAHKHNIFHVKIWKVETQCDKLT